MTSKYKQAKQVLADESDSPSYYQQPNKIFYRYKVEAKTEYKNWFMRDYGVRTMIDIKKDLLEFQIHCLNTEQLQVAELVKNAIERITELEQSLQSKESTMQFMIQEASVRDLEQQAKGLEEMLDVTDTWSVMNTYAINVDDIYEQMQELREQAAKLKESM